MIKIHEKRGSTEGLAIEIDSYVVEVAIKDIRGKIATGSIFSDSENIHLSRTM